MNKIIRYALIGTTALALTACSSSTYTIKQEKNNQVLKVPAWYMKDYSENKECGKTLFGKNKTKQCVFGVGTSTSPDLELAIDKAMMISKAEVADKVKGEMNKKAKIFVTELGKSQNKTVVTDVESTLINVIKNTKVRGYEVFAQEVTLTKQGYYRAWIGLRLPLGEFNKMYNYAIDEVADSYNLKEHANKAYAEVEAIADAD